MLSSPRDIVFGHNDLLAANFLDDGSKVRVFKKTNEESEVQ